MKKTIFLLLLFIASLQLEAQTTLANKLKITGNTTSVDALKVNVQETDGTVNTISKSDLVDAIIVNTTAELTAGIGNINKLYATRDNNILYRFNGTIYVPLSADVSGKEDIVNKSSSFTVSSIATYPNTKALVDGLATKATGTGTVSGANTGDETTATIQSKRPLKTIEGQSLEGSGNIDLAKSDVGLANVDNTTDLLKPISTATQNALNAKQNTLVSGTNIRTINGNSLLGSTDLVISAGTGTVTSVTGANGVTVATGTTTPVIGLGAITPTSIVASGAISGSNLSGTNTGDNATNTQYSGLVTNATHSGDATGATVLTLATVNANVGNFGTASSVPQYTVNAKGLTTAAANVPIQITQSQVTSLGTDLGLKANLASPTFTGTPNLPTGTIAVTQTAGNSTTAPATTAFVGSAISTADAGNVKLTGNQTIAGQKTFSSTPLFNTAILLKQNGINAYNVIEARDGEISLGVNSGTALNFKLRNNGVEFGSAGLIAKISNNLITGNKSYELPDYFGVSPMTIALVNNPTPITATSFIKSSAPATNILLANGTDITQASLPFLPLSGGTLTGALNGTSASFSGASNFATTSGNVGIGTTTATRKLSIGGNANAYQSFEKTGRVVTIGSDSEGAFIIADDTDGAYRFVIKPTNGNVLIGTQTDNGAKLQVAGAATFSSNITAGGNLNLSGGGFFTEGLELRGRTLIRSEVTNGDLKVFQYNSSGSYLRDALNISNATGAATFSSSVTASALNINDSNSYTFGSGSVKVLGNSAANVMDIQTNNTSALFIGSTQIPRFSALAGTGTRSVVTDASGNLSAVASVDSRPYKVYTALLSQTGTNAPVATVLENNLGGTVVWTRYGPGGYSGTLTGVFTSLKTWSTISGNYNTPNSFLRLNRTDLNSMSIVTESGTSTSDNILELTSIEIRVYN
jgi:hypothetical protein